MLSQVRFFVTPGTIAQLPEKPIKSLKNTYAFFQVFIEFVTVFLLFYV